MPYDRIVFNLIGKTRREMLEGREHVVVPAAILAEGVVEGSGGAIFYPKEEILNSVPTWDNKPAVVYHPDNNGTPISACHPVVLNTRGVGRMLSTRHDDKLRTECWLDVERTRQIDNRILDAVNEGKPVEVSTGLFLDLEMKAGEHDGKKYIGIARNFRPDHLAILPDKVGAYSVAAGGGMFANAAKAKMVKGSTLPQSISEAMNRSALASLGPVRAEFAANELSFDEVSCELCDLLSAKYGEPGKYWRGYVCATYPDYVVFRNSDDKTYMIGYTNDGTTVALSGEAKPVERVVSYEVVGSEDAYVGNSDGTLTRKKGVSNVAFDRKLHIQGLMANGFDEADRSSLEAVPDHVLQKIAGKAGGTPPAVPTQNTQTPAVAPQTPAAGGQQQPLTVQQYVANAPPQLRYALEGIVANAEAQMEAMIKDIMAHPMNRFKEEALRASPINNVAAIHALLPPKSGANGYGEPTPLFGPGSQPGANYYGAAGAPPVHNLGPAEPLPLPDMWAK